MEDVGLPRGATPDPDNPGWFSWGDFPRSSFAAATGRLLFKPDGPNRGIARMFPTEDHMNMGGSLHGGSVMSFIDMSMFAGGLCGSRQDGPAGAYLWGGVGRGTSMLMDLAFEHIDVHPKCRVHFSEFMLETDARLRRIRQKEEDDPIEAVAEEVADEARLLCF